METDSWKGYHPCAQASRNTSVGQFKLLPSVSSVTGTGWCNTLWAIAMEAVGRKGRHAPLYASSDVQKPK